MKKTFLLLLVLIAFSSCEKDDICDANTITTPRLIIDFYDNLTFGTIPTTKAVTNLGISSVGFSNVILNAVTKIQVPLKVTDDVTAFTFTLNAGATVAPLPQSDQLQFNCTRKNVFISRACGYKTTFTLNSVSLNGTIVTATNTITSTWIQKIQVIQTNINNENETHIKIYF